MHFKVLGNYLSDLFRFVPSRMIGRSFVSSEMAPQSTPLNFSVSNGTSSLLLFPIVNVRPFCEKRLSTSRARGAAVRNSNIAAQPRAILVIRVIPEAKSSVPTRPEGQEMKPSGKKMEGQVMRVSAVSAAPTCLVQSENPNMSLRRFQSRSVQNENDAENKVRK
jgi:hypothetical protein